VKRSDTAFARRQVALRRLLLDGQGNLKPEAKTVLVAFKHACHAGRGTRLTVAGPNGVDPIGTVAAAARRELWDSFITMLNLDDYQAVNIREED
jgi:hypothetical protein